PAGLMGLLEIFAKPWATPMPKPAKVVSRETDSQPVFPDAVLLDMEPLTKSYGGVRALDGAGIAVARGEILGLIGPNGSGKTTLANLITGLDRADAGRIWISGAEITRWPAHRIARAHVARSFQTPDLPARLTVLDAVAAGADAALARARAMAAMTLDKVGYDGDRTTFCGDLPHGLRRLVELARALVTGPEVIILDEPAAGLSPREADALAGVLTGLAKEGRGLVIIDHNIDFLLPVCHRLVCLDRGRVIADGDPREVAREARVAAAYFGEAV
ncbi:MAG: ATP-binding cassette domain-containing protein, partial [Alphaproteobacteria bacterium]|nr:ATP-binding cassette domain-containing protein [Alphaproteobacteria bacterium]